jgi:hypothetical protein
VVRKKPLGPDSDAAKQYLLSRRDSAIVAWHEVPGKAPSKEPSRRVRYDRGAARPKDSGWGQTP